MFKRIIVAIDGSQTSRHAFAVALDGKQVAAGHVPKTTD